MQCKIQNNSNSLYETDYEKEELSYLMKNFDLKSNELFYKEEIELLFTFKIKSLYNFKSFKNLKVLSIISPILNQDEEIKNIKNKSNNYTDNDIDNPININISNFSVNGIQHISHSLKTLRLVNCNLKEIDKNFTKLKFLENLSLAENKISEIRNLNYCINLKKLYLYSNEISKIEYLQDCLLLEEIDLSDNQIPKIENLDALNNLRVLNISANKIENLININNIKYITNLRELRFNDENFWPDIICENFECYFEYVLKLKPELLILDFFNLNHGNKKTTHKNKSKFYFDYENFSLNSQEIQEKIISYKNLRNKEISFIKENLNQINLLNDRKSENFDTKIWRNDDSIFYTIDLKIEKILNLEMEYYMGNMVKSIVRSNKNIENLKNEIKIKQNILFEYINILNEILLYIRENNLSFMILQTEYIYEFFKKFFPLYYFESITAVPLIIMKYIENSDQYEFESYVDFCNYDMIIIEDYKIEKIINIIGQITVNKSSSLNYDKIKFFKLKELAEKLNLKQEKIFAAIFLNKEEGVKYIIYFFDMIEASSILLQDGEKKEEDQMFLVKENEYQLNKYLSSNIKDADQIEIDYLIEQANSLDEQIKQNEILFENLMSDNNESFDELIALVNNT